MFYKTSLSLVILIQSGNTPEISEQKKEKKLFLSLPWGEEKSATRFSYQGKNQKTPLKRRTVYAHWADSLVPLGKQKKTKKVVSWANFGNP